MLAPHCENCGGLLESAPAGAAAGPGAQFGGAHGPRISPAFGQLLRTVLVGLLLFAAARFGWDAGGFGLALAAIGVVGLFTLPLIVGE
jgi:hypothetical protein